MVTNRDIISTRPGLGVSEAVQIPVQGNIVDTVPVETAGPELWAEIGSFDTGAEARSFWSKYSRKTGTENLRMRQIDPINARQLGDLVLIQVGPFASESELDGFCDKADRDQDVAYCDPVAPVMQNKFYKEAELMNRQVIRYAGQNGAARSHYYNHSQQTAGIWVQLGSFASEQQAQSRYSEVRSQAAGVLEFLEPAISPSPFVNGNKSSYRLRVGPFGTIQEASKTCDKLRSQSILCLVIQK